MKPFKNPDSYFRSKWFCTLAGATAGFIVAWLLKEFSLPQRSAPSARALVHQPASFPAAKNSDGPGSAVEAGSTSPSQILARFSRALASKNDLERWQGVMREMDLITADNWRGFLAAFDDEEAASGASLKGQRQTVLFRIGQIAGLEAVAELAAAQRQTGIAKDLGECIIGWASASPEAALEWWARQPEGRDKKSLTQAMLWGLSQARLSAVKEFFSRLPESERKASAGAAIDCLIQNGSFADAQELLTLEAGGLGQPQVASMLFNVLADKVWKISSRQGDEASACQWILQHAGRPYAGGGHLDNSVSQWAGRDAASALSWLGRQLQHGQTLGGMDKTGAQLIRLNPAVTGQWLDQNPSIAIFDQAIAGALQRGEIDAAGRQQWLSRIRDGALRAQSSTEPPRN